MNGNLMRGLLALSMFWLSAGQSGADQKDDEAAIRKCVESYTVAFNKRDAKALANHWMPEAIYIDPDSGKQVVGRAAIQKHFAKEFEELKEAKLNVAVESIKFISPHVAVENGVAIIRGKNKEVSKSKYSAIHVKRDGKWLLDRVTEEESREVMSNHDKLKELAWMVGSWIDAEDDRTTIETTCNWAKNQSFLIRTFSINVRDRVTSSGVQVIGWDPTAKKIRSWVFDSAGGFGEGVWIKKGKAWHIQNKDILANGEKASAVSIITIIDENSFTWQMVDRQVAGYVLPNVGAQKVVRIHSKD
jgi:uncharacterized protein (TIGR02246 family)